LSANTASIGTTTKQQRMTFSDLEWHHPHRALSLRYLCFLLLNVWSLIRLRCGLF